MTEETKIEHTLSEHTHGTDGCKHETLTHGGHVDCVHDGHRHAEHRDHYDEH
ncbi:zinc transporter permease [Arthrobacter halodurans]|uniref:Zinc transporter permease n=1 Tax=Arthrobacter halodurans TaxID=516699 RepID=A0ABV4UMD3_9MICC